MSTDRGFGRFTIERVEDGNHREREGRDGRIRVGKCPRILWIVCEGGETVAEYETRREALEAYPDTPITNKNYRG